MSVIVFISLFVLYATPATSHAELGDFQIYVFPGAWAMDAPDGWISQHHIRHLEVDRWRDERGHEKGQMGGALTGVDDITAEQYIIKIGYVCHNGGTRQFQLVNMLILPFTNMEVELTNATDEGKYFSGSGVCDPYWMTSYGWHNKSATVHLGGNFCVKLPFGDYDRGDPASLGNNRFGMLTTITSHLRYPMGNGLWMADFGQNFLWNGENRDIDYDERDTMETNLLICYYPSKETTKLGLFTHLDYMRAVNDTETSAGKLDDGNGWSFGAGLGVTYAITRNVIANFKYSEDIDGKEYRMDKAYHFMLSWKH